MGESTRSCSPVSNMVYTSIRDVTLPMSSCMAYPGHAVLRTRRIGKVAMSVFASPNLVGMDECENVARIRTLPRLAFAAARSPGDWTACDDAARALVIDGMVVMRSDGIMMLVHAAIEGLGILHAPGFTVESALAKGDLVRLLGNYRFASLDLQMSTTTGITSRRESGR